MTIERALTDWLSHELPAVDDSRDAWWKGEECDACGDALFADAERDERGVQRCGRCCEMHENANRLQPERDPW